MGLDDEDKIDGNENAAYSEPSIDTKIEMDQLPVTGTEVGRSLGTRLYM